MNTSTVGAARVANGRGSISYDDATTIATVRVTLPDGRRRKRVIRRSTGERPAPFRRRVETARDEMLAEVAAGVTAPGRITFEALADEWIERQATRRSPSTVAHYRRILAYYVGPHLGSHSVASITREDVEGLDAKLHRAGKGHGTRKHARMLVRQVLREAKRRKMVDRVATDDADELLAAPADERKTAAKRRRSKAIPPAQVGRFLDLAADETDGAAVAFMAYTGCRRGEALGLGWDDLDLEAGTAIIRHNLTVISEPGKPSEMVLTTPKTSSGSRTIPLAPRLVATLRAHRIRQAEHRLAAGSAWSGTVVGTDDEGNRIESVLVFADEAGRPLSVSRLRNLIADLGKRAGIEGAMHPHRMRHAAATFLLEAVSRGEITLADAAAMLGHRDASMILTIYGHETVEGVGRAADAIGNAIAGSGS